MDMDFQGIPDLAVRSIEERVAELENRVSEIAQYLFKKIGETQPTTVLETQDDERGKPFFKTMEEVQERDEPKG